MRRAKTAEPIDLPFGCGLEWAEGSASSIVFSRWRQCALIGGHIGAIWRIRLKRLLRRMRCGLMSSHCHHGVRVRAGLVEFSAGSVNYLQFQIQVWFFSDGQSSEQLLSSRVITEGEWYPKTCATSTLQASVTYITCVPSNKLDTFPAVGQNW